MTAPDDSPLKPRNPVEGKPATHHLMNHALAYAGAGLLVLPVEPNGKRPLCTHGKDDATADTEQVRDWWVQHPDANIGLRPAPGVVVLDVDPRNGGATALAELSRTHGGLRSTRTAWTGGGGLHAWYRFHGDVRAVLCPGVDLKTHRGYLVAPPSVHPSGGTYRWGNDLPILSAPLWLRPLLRRPAVQPTVRANGGSAGSAAEGLVRTVASSAEGGRNAALHWAACRAAERGAPTELLDQLREAAGSVGLAEVEIERTLNSALRTAVAA